jgi:hypothetical protein
LIQLGTNNNNLNWAKTIYVIILDLFFIISGYSQVKDNYRRIIVTGGVYDIVSLDSLPASEILINKKRRLITDNTGFFCASLLITDTLTFSHLGYLTSEILISDLTTNYDSLQINVLMKEQIYKIPEVSVFPYKTYDEFKRSIINHDINNQELNNAHENIRMMKAQIKNGYFPNNDGRESYSYLMSYKNSYSNSIVLFSSPPNKGIIPALKKILNR